MLRLLLLFITIGMSQGAVAEVATDKEICTSANRSLLKNAGYSSCSIASLCGDPTSIYIGKSKDTSREDGLKMVEKLKSMGCTNVVLLNNPENENGNVVSIASDNCKVIQLEACPKGLGYNGYETSFVDLRSRTPYSVGTQVCLASALRNKSSGKTNSKSNDNSSDKSTK